MSNYIFKIEKAEKEGEFNGKSRQKNGGCKRL